MSFPNPFNPCAPGSLAYEAALELQQELDRGQVAPGFATAPLFEAGGGKMFGVMVARASTGQLEVLRAFSGMIFGQWMLPGHAPPLFELEVRASVEVPGEATVKALIARHEELANTPARAALRARLDEEVRAQQESKAALRRVHADRQRRRQAVRDSGPDAAVLEALAQESRRDKAERKEQARQHAAELQTLNAAWRRSERRLRASERLRIWYCGRLMQRIHQTYRVPNARGETVPLRALYAGEPPSGAGDCAGPKLLAQAYARGLEPLAMAEFWWGAPPAAGGRVSGAFYPACRGKCGPLLPFMLQGLEVEDLRPFSPAESDAPLSIVFEDEWLVVVDKAAGLLSVPGKEGTPDDSVLQRLRTRYPGAMLVHRLDLDTSGLLVAAKDEETYVALQRQFAERAVQKRYVAMLDGEVRGEAGTISFPIRVDLDDRPRQICDPVHGKAAVTEWRVVERRGGKTRVWLSPLTGRTHQLRVHASHPQGLSAPIVGDRLYGLEGERLMLHAESLAFIHPRTGAPMRFESPAPF